MCKQQHSTDKSNNSLGSWIHDAKSSIVSLNAINVNQEKVQEWIRSLKVSPWLHTVFVQMRGAAFSVPLGERSPWLEEVFTSRRRRKQFPPGLRQFRWNNRAEEALLSQEETHIHEHTNAHTGRQAGNLAAQSQAYNDANTCAENTQNNNFCYDKLQDELK